MISELILENIRRALGISHHPLHIKRVMRMRGEISSRHKNWIINETPKFYLQLSGCTSLQYPGGRLRINEREILLLAPHIPHHETKIHGNNPYTALVVNFRDGKMQVIISGKKEEGHVRKMPERDYINNMFRSACMEIIRLLLGGEDTLGEKIQLEILYTFLRLLEQGYVTESVGIKRHHPLIEDALLLINEKISDASLTIGYLARTLHCSPEHLSRIFSQQMQTSLKDYLTAQRMQLASGILLSQPAASISAVAYMAGYSSSGYFCTSFKNHYGLSPAKFRRQNFH